MGLSESLIPWGRQPDGPLAAAQWGVVGYLGPDLLLYVMIVAAVEASAYAWESRQRAVAVATYERQLVEARLHVLSAQLQPHFLFNALHAISALVWQDPARADRLLARLSEMLRLTLRSGTRVETTLAEEVTLLQRYAEIQEARYGDRLKVSFEVEAGVREALVPRLILQPLVENAIRHGVTRRITPGQVDVRAWEGEGRLHLTVRDDGVGLPRRRPGAGGRRSLDHPRAAEPALRTRAAVHAHARARGRRGLLSLHPAADGTGAVMSESPIRALIVDDEPLARARLLGLLAKHRDVEIVGECAEGAEAIDVIGREQPDVVFLDVQMTETSGLDVAQSLAGEPLPAIVFVTAYERYALDAFDARALDYLLKPFEEDRFLAALERVRAYTSALRTQRSHEHLLSILRELSATPPARARAPSLAGDPAPVRRPGGGHRHARCAPGRGAGFAPTQGVRASARPDAPVGRPGDPARAAGGSVGVQ